MAATAAPEPRRQRWPGTHLGADPVADPPAAVDTSGGTGGGTGTPNGIDGPQQEESAPTALSIVAKTGALSFTTNSPDAEGYRVFASLAGAPAKAIMTTKTGSAALPKVAPCVKADYTLSAFMTSVGWLSDPSGP